MQTTLDYMSNRDLFSNHYLVEHLPETDGWEVDREESRGAFEDVRELYEEEKGLVENYNESALEKNFIRPLFGMLGHIHEVEETVQRGRRRPDYALFESEELRRQAVQGKEDDRDFYRNAVSVADAKQWGLSLDKLSTSGEEVRDFTNPSHQIHVYLQETPVDWAVLTNGRQWRVYYSGTSHKLDSYYEIDLPTLLETGDLEDFKYFYLFFRNQAFVEDRGGKSFLDRVLEGSNTFSQELGDDLQDNIYEAIKLLAEGFLKYPDNDLDPEEDLKLIHDSSLIYLYRLIFVLYAESEGRDLLDTRNEIYYERYSLNTLKQEVVEELESGEPGYRDWQDDLWDRLDELFRLIDQGSRSRGIPEEDLYVPAYNGGLFKTDPDEEDDRESRFLRNHKVGDSYLAEVIELLTRSEAHEGRGKVFVDYSSLDIRHLGSIYEGLLEYNLNVASEPMVAVRDDGEEWMTDDEFEEEDDYDDDDVVEHADEGDVYLTTDRGERKATGSYYTPEYVVQYIVENTLDPILEDIREGVVGQTTHSQDNFAEDFADRVFDLRILDPAMGSGHFLTNAVDHLAREIIDAQEKQADDAGIETVDESHDIHWARRQVAQKCIYGVDLNSMAVELSKLSLWLRTLAAEQPLAFLDHHLKTGNSLVGSNIEEIDALERSSNGNGDNGPNSTLTDFGMTFEGTMEDLMSIKQDIIAIENEELDDIKEMEERYGEFEKNELRLRLEAIADVRTAEEFGVDVPSGAYERMAPALKDEAEWRDVEATEWFAEARELAERENFFHWRLEYPEAFYDEGGDERKNAGFDAVIGNPPYIRSRNLSDSQKNYYKTNFQSAEGAYDIYIPFVEMAATLGDRNSYIIPNKWTTTDYGEKIRQLLLDEYELQELVDVSHLGVFPDADIYPLIISYSSDRGEVADEIMIRRVSEPNSIGSSSGVSLSVDIIDQLGGRVIPINLNPEFKPVLEKALSQETNLGDHIVMTEAIHTGNVRSKLIVNEKVDSTCEKLADGKSIDRYQVEWSGKWIRYDEDLIDSDNGEYGDLRDRDLFDCDEKIFIRDISYRPVAAYDDDQLFALNTLYSVTQRASSTLDLRYILAVFNSNLVNRYFRQVYGGTHVSGDYLRFKPMFSYNIPFPRPDTDTVQKERVSALLDDYEEYLSDSAPPPHPDEDDVAHDFLAELAERMTEYKEEHAALNLSLLDYLGVSTEDSLDGYRLGDLYMPAAGVADSSVSKTKEDLDSLRLGRVEIERDGDKLVLSASARYKPENEEEYETDRWGYTETDPEPVMEFTGLSDVEAALIREFVPVAVDEAGGFAGFRETATKTKSVVDRLEELTLPDIDRVESGLNRYLDVKEQAEELDRKIEKTDELIDEIVYDLYGLTEEEIEIVEEAVE